MVQYPLCAGVLESYENVHKIVSNLDRRWIPGLLGRLSNLLKENLKLSSFEVDEMWVWMRSSRVVRARTAYCPYIRASIDTVKSEGRQMKQC